MLTSWLEVAVRVISPTVMMDGACDSVTDQAGSSVNSAAEVDTVGEVTWTFRTS